MNDTFRMIACSSLSHERRTDRYFPAGRTVGDYLHDLGWKTDGLNARVFIDGEYIPDAEWLTAEPKPGQAVIVRRVFSGGGRGGNQQGKQIMQLVGMLAVALGAAYAAPFLASALGSAAGLGMGGGIVGAVGAPVVQGILTVGGALAMNGLVPASRPRRALPHPVREQLPEAA